MAFIGNTGRLELEDWEKSYVSAASGAIGQSLSETQKITVFPHWEKPYTVQPPPAIGPHGGGDIFLCEDLFGDPKPDPYRRAADHRAGARSILTGIAANVALETGQPVRVDDLLKLP